MAVKVEIPYHTIWSFSQSATEVFAYFQNVEVALPAHFPGLQAVKKNGPDTFLWQFEPIAYSGYSLDFKFSTKFKIEPGKSIEAFPDAGGGMGQLHAQWTFKETHACQVEFRAKLEVELPVPALLKSMASALATKEFTKLFERYSASVTKKFKT